MITKHIISFARSSHANQLIDREVKPRQCDFILLSALNQWCYHALVTGRLFEHYEVTDTKIIKKIAFVFRQHVIKYRKRGVREKDAIKY